MAKNEQPPTESRRLERVVIEYLSEMGSPSPCYIVREQLRKEMAKAVGVPDPAEMLRLWRKSK